MVQGNDNTLDECNRLAHVRLPARLLVPDCLQAGYRAGKQSVSGKGQVIIVLIAVASRVVAQDTEPVLEGRRQRKFFNGLD